MNIQSNSVTISSPALIPLPAKCKVLDGDCDVSNLDAISYNNNELIDSCDYLKEQLRRFEIDVHEHRLIPQTDNSTTHGSTQTCLFLELDGALSNDYDYTLSIRQSEIKIIANNSSGIFYGVQTFLQLLSNTGKSVPNIEVHDKARCKYRGLHLDVSRHFRPPEDVKRLLDLMAMHKMNYFHWHLVDDQGWRIEIKKYPLLTSIGSKRTATVIGHTLDRDTDTDATPHAGFYTQQEIKQIVRYAQQRHITVIPEIDLPGHSSALLAAYPEYSCSNHSHSAFVKTHFGIFNHVLCNRESSFSFLRDLFAEIAALFPSEYIHIGGDEVKKVHWEQCPDCQAIVHKESLKSTKDLHAYFIDRVVHILDSFNKKAICWDDVLEAQNLNSSVTIMSWLGEENAEDALARGHNLIMTQSNLYFDFYQSMSIDEPFAIHGHSPLRDVYNYNPLQNSDKILGAQANVWTEYIKTSEQLEYTVLPRMTALAEILWTPLEIQDWEGFKRRLHFQYKRFEELGINASTGVYVPEFEVSENPDGKFQVSINCEFPNLEIYYTLDNTRPDHHSLRYRSALTLSRRTVINACCVDPISGKRYGVNRIAVFPHKALNCRVTCASSCGSSAPIPDLNLLTNGFTQQGQRFQHSNWALFDGHTEFELELDLQEPTEISAISLGFDGALGRKLYFPKSAELCCSSDKENWFSKGSFTHDKIQGRTGASFERHLARYIRIKIHNPGLIYSHEDEKMITPPLYIDEIVVT